MMFIDQSASAVPAGPSSSSFVLASSTYTHRPYATDHHGSSVILPQQYVKPPEVQAFCLVQERQNPQQQLHSSYYNISASSLQAINANPTFPTVSPYNVPTYANPQMANTIPIVQQTQLVHNSHHGYAYALPHREKQASNVDPSAFMKMKVDGSEAKEPLARGNCFDQIASTGSIAKVSVNVKNMDDNVEEKSMEECLSDESSGSFDFTIEAEKMVSALCKTTSFNDLTKEAGCDKADTAICYGSGDTLSKKNWTAESENGKCGLFKFAATQTQSVGKRNCPEMIRKTTLLGCNEAESILSSVKYNVCKRSNWLLSLVAATKTAVTKSSTCFPVFAGDRFFVCDLVNSMIRISNGWLLLDNYLNKQHFPSLSGKYNDNLNSCFENWENATSELLDQLVQTFVNLEKANNSQQSDGSPESKRELSNSSIPGDVSLYTNQDLFNASPSSQPRTNPCVVSHLSIDDNQPSQTSNSYCCVNPNLSGKKSKLRNRWTITDSSSRVNEEQCNVDTSYLYNDSAYLAEANKSWSKSNNSSGSKAKSLNSEYFVHMKNKAMESSTSSFKRWLPSQKAQDPTFQGKSCCSATGNYCENRIACETGYWHAPDFANSSGSTVDSRKTAEHSDIPRNKITLLSQIEPNVSSIVKESEGMTANLSAWFASLKSLNNTMNSSINEAESAVRSDKKSHSNPTSSEMQRQMYQIDPNRQFMPIQSAQSSPWSASKLGSNRSAFRAVNDEYDSSEDIRIYMKPGSYNVPKKRHQKKSQKRLDNSSGSKKGGNSRSSSLNNSQLEKSFFSSSLKSLEEAMDQANELNSSVSTINDQQKSFNQSPSCENKVDNSEMKEDTWKAACASAEMLLEALSVKEANNDKQCDSDLSQSVQDTFKLKKGEEEDDMSNYEASEDDSDTTYKVFSVNPCDTQQSDRKSVKSNVKTDSWLIKTLSNASFSQAHQQDAETCSLKSLESLNSSDDEEELCKSATFVTSSMELANAKIMNNVYRDNRQGKSVDSKDFEDSEVTGKATYSETVRRSAAAAAAAKKDNCAKLNPKPFIQCNEAFPTIAKACGTKEADKSSQLLQKTRRLKLINDLDSEASGKSFLKLNTLKSKNAATTKLTAKTAVKDSNDGNLMECKSKGGWTVYYSSKKRQTLSPLAISKLEVILQIALKMDDSQYFQYPSSAVASVNCFNEF